MEDWQKYVFDPKNPKGFKAYKLLKKILKDGNAMLVTDMYYFNELFTKEIWTQDMIDDLWMDLPENFSDLSSNEKALVYYDNYSVYDYIDKLNSKVDEISKSGYYRLFSNFFNGIQDNKTPSSFSSKKQIDPNSIFEFSETIEYKKFTTSFFVELGCCFFIKNDESIHRKVSDYDDNLRPIYEEIKVFQPYNFLEALNLLRTSVFFINEAAVKEQGVPENENLYPIILKEEDDIYQLLDYIIRDINNEIKTIPNHKPNTYLNEVTIKNYFSLEKVELNNLGDKKEIYLMGENGDGKTILLQAIALTLRGNQNIGAVIDIVKQNPYRNLTLTATTTDKEIYKYYKTVKLQKKSFNSILGYGIERFRNDSDKKDEVGYLSLFNKETYLENPEKWLQHLDYKEARGDYSELSVLQAKEILIDILGGDVKIEVTPDKVTFTEKGTPLNFEQLSDGYQSVIIWVCDLIARFAKLQPNASSTQDYSGVVIVDEIGAYLHPKWAYSIVKKLREWFPNLQFIFTTHNPIVILGASEEAVFYKVYKEEGKTKVSEPVKDISDLMLNSLVTSPLFNLPTARPKGFDDSNDLSSDDYIYRRIHQKIQEKLQTMPNLIDEDVLKMIEAELEKI